MFTPMRPFLRLELLLSLRRANLLYFHPQSLRTKLRAPAGSSLIFILELCAILLGLLLAQKYSPPGGVNAIFFEDNDACQSALLRGHTKCPVGTELIHKFWRMQSNGSCQVWIERISSSINCADAPSRGQGPYEVIDFPF